MATAEVYVKWSNMGDGDRARGGWAKKGDGLAAGGGAAGIIALGNHAERQAWKDAWGNQNHNNIRAYVAGSIANHANDTFEIKFWLDQQVCPACQKWMLIDVIAQAKLLKELHQGLIYKIYVEVQAHDGTHRIPLGRETVWPVTVGNKATYAELPDVYV